MIETHLSLRCEIMNVQISGYGEGDKCLKWEELKYSQVVLTHHSIKSIDNTHKKIFKTKCNKTFRWLVSSVIFLIIFIEDLFYYCYLSFSFSFLDFYRWESVKYISNFVCRKWGEEERTADFAQCNVSNISFCMLSE